MFMHSQNSARNNTMLLFVIQYIICLSSDSQKFVDGSKMMFKILQQHFRNGNNLWFVFSNLVLSWYFTCLLIGRGDKLENFDLIFFPTSKTWKGLLTTN